MSSRRKKPKGRRKSSQSARTDRRVGILTSAQVSSGEDFIRAGRGVAPDFDLAMDNFEAMMSYEVWLSSGGEEEFPFLELPGWYVGVARHSADAFEFCRHHSFLYVAAALELAPWGDMLFSLMCQVRERFPDETPELLNALDGCYEGFLRQYKEATGAFGSILLLDDPVQRLRNALSAWAAVYETDAPLWLLGLLGKALSGDSLRSGAFGGPASRTAQGALVRSIQDAVAGTPLEGPISSVYDTDLRNCIAHNDFELKILNGRVQLTEGPSGRRWTGQELWEITLGGQHLLQSVLNAIQMFRVTHQTGGLEACGILSATYSTGRAGLPEVILSQLWANRDLDPAARWLYRDGLKLRVVADVMELWAGDNLLIVGPELTCDIVESIETKGWIAVQRSAVAPTLGLGRGLLRLDGGEVMDVIGPPEHHFVRISVVRDSDGAPSRWDPFWFWVSSEDA